MNNEPLKITNDITFQRLFGKIGNENITKGFLEKILGIEIESLSLDTNKRLIGKNLNDKIGRVDVKAKLNDGTKVIIEMQVERYNYMAKRMLYYWAENYVGDLRRGHEYDELQKTICILISVENLKETKELDEYHTKWELLESNHPNKKFSEDIEIHVIELNKFKEGKEERPEDNWIRFIKSKGVDDLKKISDVENEIKEALEELDRMEGDPELREEYEALEYEVREKASFLKAAKEEGLEAGRREGIREGKKEGKKEGRKEGEKLKQKEIIINMYKRKMKIEDICDIVNLNIEEVKKIINEDK